MSAQIIRPVFPVFNPRAAHPRLTACDVLPLERRSTVSAVVVPTPVEPIVSEKPFAEVALPWLAGKGYQTFTYGTAHGVRL